MEEKMWQCKADILRLEFLWHHGGVYVDADMISVGKKSLNPIVELGKERSASFFVSAVAHIYFQQQKNMIESNN